MSYRRAIQRKHIKELKRMAEKKMKEPVTYFIPVIKSEGVWEGAKFVGSKYKGSKFGDSLNDVVKNHLTPALMKEYPDGTNVHINMSIEVPDEEEGKSGKGKS